MITFKQRNSLYVEARKLFEESNEHWLVVTVSKETAEKILEAEGLLIRQVEQLDGDFKRLHVDFDWQMQKADTARRAAIKAYKKAIRIQRKADRARVKNG